MNTSILDKFCFVRKLSSVTFGSLLSISAIAQDASIFYEKQNQATILCATNNEFYPVTMELHLNLVNMNFSSTSTQLHVVPAKTVKFKLGELTVAKSNEAPRFELEYEIAMGDVTKPYDKDYVYDLPFAKGKSCKVFQGYNGKFSHQNENSLDFNMALGSEILSARDGIVVEIVQNNNQSCPREECKKFTNYITIHHSDGTFARYGHIMFNGAKVNLGDKVKKGELIALSGNTGWSTGPHLHFVCFTGAFGKSNTLITKFRNENGQKIAVLKEGSLYTRNY